ncbi:hypothetical protein [Armatimonas sp.]|uniref:hypothetical protein n=1 Tax=Armatimonas sp. TaxID=1872638 RepID=UPI0037500A44
MLATPSITTTPSPLSPALRKLLEAALALRTTNNQVLAEALICSEETIKSRFRRLSLLLGTRSRAESLLYALLNGWVQLTQKP